MDNAIHSHGQTFAAELCERCGVKIFPGSKMEYHKKKHRVRDLIFKRNLSDLRIRFRRLRDWKEWEVDGMRFIGGK